MDRVRILVVGSAFSADLHMEGYARFRDKARLVGICTKDRDQARALLARYGMDCPLFEDYAEAIAAVDCDVVDVCVPNFLHCPVTLKAIEHGRDVICEKPLATTARDARAMVEAAAAAGRHIYYAEDWLFAPAIRRAVELVEEGAIGKLLYIRARECHSGSHSPFAQTIASCGGGAMIHLGIHPIGFALAMKGSAWTELTAMTSGGLGKNMRHQAMEGEDWAACMLRFADGSHALLEGNYIAMGGMEDVLDFYGTEGCLHVDLNFSSAVSCFSLPGVSYAVEKAELTTGWTRPAVDEKYNLGYVGEIGHFLDCARAGTGAMAGLRGADGLAAMEVIEAIYASASQGKAISNPRA